LSRSIDFFSLWVLVVLQRARTRRDREFWAGNWTDGGPGSTCPKS
jgi:hypothetical protein